MTCDCSTYSSYSVTESVILSGRYRGVTVRMREIKRKPIQGFLRLNKSQFVCLPACPVSSAAPRYTESVFGFRFGRRPVWPPMPRPRLLLQLLSGGGGVGFPLRGRVRVE